LGYSSNSIFSNLKKTGGGGIWRRLQRKETKKKNKEGRLERKQRKTRKGLRERREVRMKNRGGLER